MSILQNLPVINRLTNNNLASQKLYAKEMHQFLLNSGLLPSSDTGQIDFDSVSALPTTDNTSLGYKIYQIDDDLADQDFGIKIRIDYGTGPEGLYNFDYFVRFNFKVQISIAPKSDGAGTLLSQDGTTALAPTISIQVPQAYSDASSSGHVCTTSPGRKYSSFNPDKGFYGVVFDCNSRGNITYYPFNACSLCFFIQRSIDSQGVPTNIGVSIFGPGLKSNAVNNNNRYPSVINMSTGVTGSISSAFTYTSAGTTSTNFLNASACAVDASPKNGQIQISPCYTYINGTLQYWPNMVTHRSADLSEGSTFTAQTSLGGYTNFLSLGPGTGIQVDVQSSRISVAMLQE